MVGYPILDLRARGRDLHRYLRKLEDLLIDLLTEFEIKGDKIEGKTGVWVRGPQDRFDRGRGPQVGDDARFRAQRGERSERLSEHHSLWLSGVRMTSISIESGKEVSLETVREKMSPYLRRYLDGSVSASVS